MNSKVKSCFYDSILNLSCITGQGLKFEANLRQILKKHQNKLNLLAKK